MSSIKYNFLETEKKWQKYWLDNKTFKSEINNKPKYYVMDMFPYPSGSGLHVGHPLGYIASDIISRYKRLEGYNVLHPMGFDSFGLPAEQYAIKTGQHPKITTDKNIIRFKDQLNKLGLSYDWDREIKTSDSEYYKWTQWMFIKMFNSWYDFKKDKVINKQCNVSNQTDLNNLINEVNQEFGLIDIFCSNAGILSLGSEQSSNEDWDKNWNLHVMSHVFASKKLIPDMLKRGSGYFVNTASAAGLLSHIDSATYSTTKHAAIGFAEWLAITYGKEGIGVSILCPQAVKTAMIKGRENEVSALDGMMKPETVAIEVVKAIKNDIFLISPHSEVVGYFQNKANNYARWIGGMQKLRSRLKS